MVASPRPAWRAVGAAPAPASAPATTIRSATRSNCASCRSVAPARVAGPAAGWAPGVWSATVRERPVQDTTRGANTRAPRLRLPFETSAQAESVAERDEEAPVFHVRAVCDLAQAEVVATLQREAV